MADYTMQIGFKWEDATESNTGSLSFVFLCDDKRYGKACAAGQDDQSSRYSYGFADQDSLTWEIFDLSEKKTTRRLNLVKVPFSGGKAGETPFAHNAYSPPHSAPAFGTKTCGLLPGANAGVLYPYWTPGVSFAFENTSGRKKTFRFTVSFEVEQVGSVPRRYFVDPEMIVGSGSGA